MTRWSLTIPLTPERLAWWQERMLHTIHHVRQRFPRARLVFRKLHRTNDAVAGTQYITNRAFILAAAFESGIDMALLHWLSSCSVRLASPASLRATTSHCFVPADFLFLLQTRPPAPSPAGGSRALGRSAHLRCVLSSFPRLAFCGFAYVHLCSLSGLIKPCSRRL